MKKQSDQIRTLIRSILLEDAAATRKGPEFYTTARGEEFRVPTFSTKTVPRAPDDEESEESDDTRPQEKSEPEVSPPEKRGPFDPISPGDAKSMPSADAATRTTSASPTPAPTTTAPAATPSQKPSGDASTYIEPIVRRNIFALGGGARTRLPAGAVISDPEAAGIKFTSLYNAQRTGRLHKGIDIVYEGDNIVGADVYAIRAGQVIDLSNFSRDDRGKYVTIKHGDDGQSTYMHLKELGSNISKGDGVAAGERIGAVGSTGSSSGPHLHLETKDENGNYVNPLEYLKKTNMKLIFPVPAIKPQSQDLQ